MLIGASLAIILPIVLSKHDLYLKTYNQDLYSEERCKILKSLDNLLMTVISEAKALNIPVSDEIDSKVAVNSRAVRRFGCCIVKDNKFYIEISSKLLDAPEQMRKQTLAHEILHTCPGCKNHGNRWKQYAQK